MSDHYYTENPISEIHEKQFSQQLTCGASVKLTSVSGVFSYGDRIDRASLLLIDTFIKNAGILSAAISAAPTVSDAHSLLDLGCGYGAIGISLKLALPWFDVSMCDINSRAVEYALRNAAANRVNVSAVHSDLFSALADSKFDFIVTNPPIAMGKNFLTGMMRECLCHLNSGGEFWFTAFHNKGGSTLQKAASDIFGNCTDIAKSGGIRIYRSIVV